jgi:peptidyl-prolyl cis-trans isomerase D
MLSQMRQGQFIKTVLWVVVVTFVATMIFVWGADLQGVGCSQNAPQGQQWVGKVGSHGLSLADYDRRLRQAVSQLAQGREPGQVISEDERLRVADQVFEQMVNEQLFEMEVARLKLMPSEAEIGDILQYDPPEILLQQFRDAQGNFDRNAYELALNNPNVDWKPFEDYVRANLPAERLQQMLVSSVHVGEGDVRLEYERRFRKMTVLYAGQAWREVKLANDTPTDEALRAYFEAHPDDFKVDERYRIEAVRLSRDPSPADEAYVRGRLDDLRREISAGGKPFAQMAKEWSQDLANAELGGDLGWFGKGRMDPAFEAAAFALAEGQVSQPVRSSFGYHLIQVDAKRKQAGADEISARHILLRVEPSYATLDSLNALADSLYAKAEAGKSLAGAARALGLAPISPPPFSKRESIAGLGFNSAIKAKVEHMEAGQISKAFQARDADYLVQLVEILPAGRADFAGKREEVLRAWREAEQRSAARQKAAALKAAVDSGRSLREAATALGMTPVQTEPFSRRDYVPGVGREGAFQIAAFLLNPGQVSGVVEAQEGAFVLQVLEKPESDKGSWLTESKRIRERLLSSAQQLYFMSWMAALKERFPVEDYRDRFYN